MAKNKCDYSETIIMNGSLLSIDKQYLKCKFVCKEERTEER